MTKRIRVCTNLEERHHEGLEQVSRVTGLGRSEVVRRILDYTLQPLHLNVLVPSMSGQIFLGK